MGQNRRITVTLTVDVEITDEMSMTEAAFKLARQTGADGEGEEYGIEEMGPFQASLYRLMMAPFNPFFGTPIPGVKVTSSTASMVERA